MWINTKSYPLDVAHDEPPLYTPDWLASADQAVDALPEQPYTENQQDRDQHNKVRMIYAGSDAAPTTSGSKLTITVSIQGRP
jgi:hypothetical protein